MLDRIRVNSTKFFLIRGTNSLAFGFSIRIGCCVWQKASKRPPGLSVGKSDVIWRTIALAIISTAAAADWGR